jgi:5'-deoxynucleotidase YfbR-like HD superfamily hydrolase
MKSRCGFTHGIITHDGTLGSLLVTDGARLTSEERISKLIDLIRERGVDSLTEQRLIIGKSWSHYHLQETRFASPLQAIRYISEHDFNLKRHVMQEVESEMAADSYFFDNAETDSISRAIIFAAKAHNGATRKGTELPYILHPMEAATIVASLTDDEEVIAAAILHDVLEDTDVTPAQLQIEFGARICKLVESESENKRPGLPAAETWKARKSETINYLQSVATDDERIIALADKLSNIRACLRDYEKSGDAMWEKFNMPDKEMQAWYYTSVRDALGKLQDTDAWKELNRLIERLFPRSEIISLTTT